MMLAEPAVAPPPLIFHKLTPRGDSLWTISGSRGTLSIVIDKNECPTIALRTLIELCKTV